MPFQEQYAFVSNGALWHFVDKLIRSLKCHISVTIQSYLLIFSPLMSNNHHLWKMQKILMELKNKLVIIHLIEPPCITISMPNNVCFIYIYMNMYIECTVLLSLNSCLWHGSYQSNSYRTNLPNLAQLSIKLYTKFELCVAIYRRHTRDVHHNPPGFLHRVVG